MLTAVLTFGVAVLVIAFLPPLPVILSFAALIGLVYGPIGPIYNSVMQTRAPAQMRGRVVGVMTSMAYAAGPIGFMLAGPLVDAFGLEVTFVVLAVPILLSACSRRGCRPCGIWTASPIARLPRQRGAADLGWRMAVSALAELAAELPDGVVVTDPDILASYRQDRAADPTAGTAAGRGAADPHRGGADRAALGDRSTASPVVPRGAGTGLSGGATAVDGGIVLSTEQMRDITVDPVTRTAVVQPGLLNAEVKKAVAEHGLWYPPDPSSYEICSIGGNIATNAGGLCCVKYGVTTDYVLGLQVVLADGTAVRLGGPRLKDVAGLSLTKLFVGSEGTLGVITEVTLRLLPPQHPACTVVATFDSVEAAASAVVDDHRQDAARRCWSSWTRWPSTPSRTSCGWAWTARRRR